MQNELDGKVVFVIGFDPFDETAGMHLGYGNIGKP